MSGATLGKGEQFSLALLNVRCAKGTPWKQICHRYGISIPIAHRRWDYALSVIAWRLNGRQVHLRRGKRFVIERARG